MLWLLISSISEITIPKCMCISEMVAMNASSILKYLISVEITAQMRKNMILVEMCPVPQSYYVLKLYHHQLWLILFFYLFEQCCLVNLFKILHPTSYLVF